MTGNSTPRVPDARPPGRRLGALLLLAALSLTVQAESCSSDAADCTSEPAGSLSVFVEGNSTSPAHFHGTVKSIEPTTEDSATVVSFLDPIGVTWRVRVSAPGLHLPVRVDQSYDVRVEWVGGFPSVSGITISDDRGLLFAGASDQSIGGHVLKQGVSGFTLGLKSTDCASRPHGDCFDGLFNSQLSVTRGDRTVQISHPRSVILDGFKITCLTAQRVIYNSRCSDAGLYGVSWTIERLESATAAPSSPR